MVPWVTNISAISSLRRGGPRGGGGGRDKGPLGRSWQWGTLRGGMRRPGDAGRALGCQCLTPAPAGSPHQPTNRKPRGKETHWCGLLGAQKGGEEREHESERAGIETLHTMDRRNVFVSLSVKRTHTLINWEATWRYNSQGTPYMLKKFLQIQTFSSLWECLQKPCISILPDLFVIFKQ